MTGQRRGWCPSVFAPMQTGDGFLARVAPPNATLTQGAARALAAAARDFGNGVLGVTSRARIQVRGLSPDTIARFADAMADSGLADDDRLIVSPLAGDDPDVVDDLRAVAREAAAGIGDVAAKFTMVVDGGGVLRLDAVRADRRLMWRGGAWRNGSSAAAVDPPSAVGLLRYACASRAAFGVAPVFGQMDADGLDTLAGIASRFGDGTLRVSPWRTLLVAGVSLTDADAVTDAVRTAGFIVDPADPRLHVAACPGRPACASAEVATRDAAVRLAALGVRAHVSGCAKGCAHPGAAPLTLVGREGLFDVVLHGRASDVPARRALTLAEALG